MFAGLLQVSYFKFRRKHHHQQKRQLLLPRHPSLLRRRRLIGQFRLIDGRETGSSEEHRARAHPSQPFFVTINDDTGEVLEVIESDSAQHPLSNLADIRTPRDARNEEFFYFVAPYAQGSLVRNLLSHCFGLRRAEKRQDPESLDVIEGALNLNLYSRQGLINAKELDLVGRSLVDLYDTSYFYEGIQLFSPEHRARGFFMMEHPIHSAEKLFLAAKARGAIKANMKFVSYPNSTNYVDNFYVRSLTNALRGELTHEHLLVAKGIIARKFMIGIADYLAESMKRLRVYYNLKETSENCVTLNLNEAQEREEPYKTKRGSDGWNAVALVNRFDMELYYYSLELFSKQGSTLFNRPYAALEKFDFAESKKKSMLQRAFGS